VGIILFFGLFSLPSSKMRPGFDLDGGDTASTGGAFFLCTETWPRCFIIKQVFGPFLGIFIVSYMLILVREKAHAK
jgi:hypothetical protein